MSVDLVTRLRASADSLDDDEIVDVYPMTTAMREAADEIERLRAENERLHADIARYYALREQQMKEAGR